MIALLQRVIEGSVEIDHKLQGKIDEGLVVLLGVYKDDNEKDVEFLAQKSVNLRIFDDDDGNMNHSLLDIGGKMLAISQFTLCANARKGRRPSFTDAKSPDEANQLYEMFCSEVEKFGIEVQTGKFGHEMLVKIHNNGPVTIILNSRETRRGNIK